MGNLGVDSLKVGDFMVNNASIGSVTQASVNLTGASCDGIFVSTHPHTSASCLISSSSVTWSLHLALALQALFQNFLCLCRVWLALVWHARGDQRSTRCCQRR